MRRTLFENVTHRTVTEPPPPPDEAALRELASTVNRAARVRLGRSLSTSDPFFDGSFDEFRIYDVALTAQEIDRSFRDGPDRP